MAPFSTAAARILDCRGGGGAGAQRGANGRARGDERRRAVLVRRGGLISRRRAVRTSEVGAQRPGTPRSAWRAGCMCFYFTRTNALTRRDSRDPRPGPLAVFSVRRVSQTQSRLAGVRSSPSPESCETLVSVCTLGVWGHWAGHSVWGERTSPTPRMDIPRERPPAPATARARIPLPRPRPAPRRAARKGIIFANSNTRVGLGARSLSSPQCSSAAARAVLKCFNYVYKSAYSEVSISL